MKIIYVLSILFLVHSSSSEKCPVCNDDDCEKPELMTCPHEGDPTVPATSTTLTSEPTTGGTTVSSTASTTENTTESNTGTPDSKKAKLLATSDPSSSFSTASTTTSSLPSDSTVSASSSSGTTPSGHYKCASVTYSDKEKNHTQKYCVPEESSDRLCNYYYSKYGKNETASCSITDPTTDGSVKISAMLLLSIVLSIVSVQLM